MPKKNIGPRVSDKCIDWLKNNFRSVSGGAEHVLESVRHAYGRTLQEIKGKFTAGELMGMLDVMNGHMLTPLLAGEELTLCIRDAIALDALDKKWEFAADEIMERLESCTVFQLTALEWWANGYWYGGDQSADPIAPEEYVTVLAKQEK